MKTRLKDIAAATGFSVNTVSHALRDAPDISKATKQQIKAVAKELGYIPNLRASSIKSGKSRVISIILPDITNLHFTIVFRECEKSFCRMGYTPFFMNTNEDMESEMNAVRLSIAQNVDGVILCPTQKSTRSIELLERSKIPYVLIGRHFDEYPNANFVVCDDTEGGYLATSHLLSLGHKTIAYARFNKYISSDRERFAGYCKALREYGIEPNDGLILELDQNETTDTDRISAFLKAHQDCTAVLAFCDMLGYRLIREMKQLEIRVPEDISVIGFDNVCSDYTFPTMLTSISVSKKTMASTATRLLGDLIFANEDHAVSRQIVLPTRLYLRETTKEIKFK